MTSLWQNLLLLSLSTYKTKNWLIFLGNRRKNFHSDAVFFSQVFCEIRSWKWKALKFSSFCFFWFVSQNVHVSFTNKMSEVDLRSIFQDIRKGSTGGPKYLPPTTSTQGPPVAQIVVSCIWWWVSCWKWCWIIKDVKRSVIIDRDSVRKVFFWWIKNKLQVFVTIKEF